MMNSPRPREDIGSLTVATTSCDGIVWIVVRGEADLATREQLRAGLAAIELGRARLVHLDLRLLEFCDSASCRILLRFERQNKAAGREVRIHSATPGVCRVMTLLEALR